MKRIDKDWRLRDTNVEHTIAELKKLFDEINLVNDGDLKKIISKSEVPHFMRLYEVNYLSGRDIRPEIDYLFYIVLHKLEVVFSSGASVWKTEREQEIPSELRKIVQEFFKFYLDMAPKYEVTPLEYYDLLISNQINSGLHYSNNMVLRFLKDERLIIFPLDGILRIHLQVGMHNDFGTFRIERENEYAIYLKREYWRWRGVGKDDTYEIEHIRLCPDRLQIEIIDSA